MVTLVSWAEPTDAQAEVRVVRFVVFSESNASMTAVETEADSAAIPQIQFTYFDHEGERKRVDAPASGFLGPFNAQLWDNRLALFRPGVLSQDQAQASDLLASLEIPEAWSEVLVYSFRSHQKEHAQFVLLSDFTSLKNQNQTLCVNMTDKDIVIGISGQTFSLKPYEHGIVDLNTFEGDLFTIRVAAEWREDWKLVLSTTRRLRKTDSNLLLFKGSENNPRSMSLKVVTLPDY